MNKFQPFHYIKKYAVLIILFFILMTAGLYVVLNRMQSYTATATIDYSYEGADQGLVPKAANNEELNVAEIYSSVIISRALENLGMDSGEYPIDQIRSAITVTRLDDPEVAALNETKSKQDDVEDSGLLKSTKYRITYEVKDSDGEDQAKAVLDEILDEYFSWFSEKYVNSSVTTNGISDVNLVGYDYIEQIGLLEGAIDSTIESLETRAEWHPEFYSTDSGYSFNELVDSYRLLKDTRLSSLGAYILSHRVTQDGDILVSKYRQLVRSGQSDQARYRERIDEIEDNLDAYVEKLRESDNTAQTSARSSGYAFIGGNVIDDVEWPNYDEDEEILYDQRTEYEKLLQAWIDYSDSYNQSVADTEYYQYVIDCYTGNTRGIEQYQRKMAQYDGFRAGREAASAVEAVDGTEGLVPSANASKPRDVSLYLRNTDACTETDISYVEQELDGIVQELNELYATVKVTDAEFNDYVGAEYIQMVASTQVEEKLNIALYTAIGAILFLVIGGLGAVLLGRLGDIVEYMAYTDHKLRLPNRSACDRYIQKFQEKALPAGFGCMLVQVINEAEINRASGRERGDEALASFASGLKDFFGGDESFIGYNGGGQFMVFTRGVNERTVYDLLTDFRIFLKDQFEKQGIVMKYTVGVAESSRENAFRIRSLISKAAGRKQEYDTSK